MANAARVPHMRPYNTPVAIHAVAGGLDRRFVIGAIHAQYTLDAANDAPDRRTDNRADWAGTTIAFICAVGKPAWYALRLCCNRQGNKCNECGRNQNSELHEIVLPVFLMMPSWQGKKGHTAAAGCVATRTVTSVATKQRQPPSRGTQVPLIGPAGL
jgi:hypothetical protein